MLLILLHSSRMLTGFLQIVLAQRDKGLLCRSMNKLHLAASHVNYHQLSVRAFCPTFTVVQCCAPEEVQINRELHLGRHSLW